MRKFNIGEGSWYKVAQERGDWRVRCLGGLEVATGKRVQKDELSRRRKAVELMGEVSSQFG